ncbi:MAG: BlaI/MecI/CopY family transcriptional regulator [Bacteroidales bacterium]|nr:BlaI/MecI/CopY family transcriptional regulator [Bacteroidales bacterium]MCF8386647.1 BlaI/MecI/CopY family transcriptional regulator [Bacteroidales bacterium]MCF8398917.1 BlaI/MecI/CopY family transcriptional regulator [Bacteroidales bacterium]
MAKKSKHPTESELEILKVIWENGPSTVRQVNEKLNERREVGYTTSLKLMQIMVEKKLLKRNTKTRTHVYSSAIQKEDTQRQLLDSLLETAFGGSAQSLVMQALGNHKSSKKELEEIRRYIEKLEGGA